MIIVRRQHFTESLHPDHHDYGFQGESIVYIDQVLIGNIKDQLMSLILYLFTLLQLFNYHKKFQCLMMSKCLLLHPVLNLRKLLLWYVKHVCTLTLLCDDEPVSADFSMSTKN